MLRNCFNDRLGYFFGFIGFRGYNAGQMRIKKPILNENFFLFSYYLGCCYKLSLVFLPNSLALLGLWCRAMPICKVILGLWRSTMHIYRVILGLLLAFGGLLAFVLVFSVNNCQKLWSFFLLFTAPKVAASLHCQTEITAFNPLLVLFGLFCNQLLLTT